MTINNTKKGIICVMVCLALLVLGSFIEGKNYFDLVYFIIIVVYTTRYLLLNKVKKDLKD